VAYVSCAGSARRSSARRRRSAPVPSPLSVARTKAPGGGQRRWAGTRLRGPSRLTLGARSALSARYTCAPLVGLRSQPHGPAPCPPPSSNGDAARSMSVRALHVRSQLLLVFGGPSNLGRPPCAAARRSTWSRVAETALNRPPGASGRGSSRAAAVWAVRSASIGCSRERCPSGDLLTQVPRELRQAGRHRREPVSRPSRARAPAPLVQHRPRPLEPPS